MNKKYTVKNDRGDIFTCIIDTDKDVDEQFCEVLAIRKGHGFTVEVRDKEIRIVDYFAASTAGRFEILSQTESELPVDLKWTKIN